MRHILLCYAIFFQSNGTDHVACVVCIQLVVCGQALSHCVHFTVRDIFDRIQQLPHLSPSMIHLLVDGEWLVIAAVCVMI